MLLLMRELMFSSALMPADQWSTLRVVVMSAKFAVYLNDKHQFDLADETFPEAARVRSERAFFYNAGAIFSPMRRIAKTGSSCTRKQSSVMPVAT